MSQFGNTMRQTVQGAEPANDVDPGPRRIARITDFIQVVVAMLNGLIGLRFLLKLVAAANPFADAVYAVTSPLLRIFRALTRTTFVNGMEVEFFSLVAILVYAMAGWVLVQFVWILLAGRE